MIQFREDTMDDAFYAAMKIVTGEEVLAEILPSEKNDAQFFLVSNAIVVNEQSVIDHQRGLMAHALAPRRWMTYGSEDTTIVNRNHIVSISEMDKFGINFYQNALNAAKIACPIRRKIDSDDNIGYVGNVDSTRKRLEKMFDD